jgi:hypothetical protein
MNQSASPVPLALVDNGGFPQAARLEPHRVHDSRRLYSNQVALHWLAAHPMGVA